MHITNKLFRDKEHWLKKKKDDTEQDSIQNEGKDGKILQEVSTGLNKERHKYYQYSSQRKNKNVKQNKH